MGDATDPAPEMAAIEIRRNSDGEIRTSPKLYEFFDDFIWADGNFACDCNRADLFSLAAGGPDDVHHPCGDSAFSVRLRAQRSGEILYEDGGNWQ